MPQSYEAPLSLYTPATAAQMTRARNEAWNRALTVTVAASWSFKSVKAWLDKFPPLTIAPPLVSWQLLFILLPFSLFSRSLPSLFFLLINRTSYEDDPMSAHVSPWVLTLSAAACWPHPAPHR